MFRHALVLTLSTSFFLPAAAPLAAQAWDAPSFLAPRSLKEIGLSLIVPDDVDWGLVGYFRQPRAIENTVNLSFRAGYLDLENNDDRDGGSAGLAGLDAYGLVMSTSEGDRADLAWSVGLGGTFGDDVSELRVPIGVTAGLGFSVASGLTLYPYVYPRVGIDLDLEGSDTDAETGLSIDIGTDIGLGRHILLRLAGTVINESAWGIGVAWVRGGTEPVTAN